MLGSDLELHQGDRATFGAYRSRPMGSAGPGVVVLHEGFGLDDCTRENVDRLARAGFVALAPSLCDAAPTRSPAEAKRRAEGLQAELLDARIEAAITALLGDRACHGGRVGILGTGIGGALSVRLAGQHARIAAAVDLGGAPQEPPYAVEDARARFLLVVGEEDPAAGERLDYWIEALRVLGRDVTLHRQPGAGADFASEARVDRFDAAAARHAWDLSLSFLRALL